MQFSLEEQDDSHCVLVKLEPGEGFHSEAGAMLHASSNLDVDVEMVQRRGGLVGGIRGLLETTNYLLAHYDVNDEKTGELRLSYPHDGSIKKLELTGDSTWLILADLFIGATAGVRVDTRFPGFKGLRKGESPFFLRLTGEGEVLVGSAGESMEIQVRSAATVDVENLVAFQSSLSYTAVHANRRGVVGVPNGACIILNFTGTGNLLVQSCKLAVGNVTQQLQS